MRRIVSVLVLLVFFPGAGCRSRGDYPDRPILLVCPWAVGGGTDRLSRQVAAFLEVELGAPVNVINATGGSGVTGHGRGAHARPDGYTLTMMTVEINMLHWRGLTRLSWRDFAPVMLLNRDPAALFVRAGETRWKDLNELVEYVRQHPGILTASGTATGGIWHLALAGWLNSLGLAPDAVRWIPMHGAGPSLQELASGGLDLVSCSLPEARTLLAAGQVRSLAVMSESRAEGFPDTPAFGELGMDWSMGAWRGIGAPAGTPPEIVSRLAAGLERIVRGESALNGRTFPEFMANEGFTLIWAPPEEFARSLERVDRELGTLLTSPEFARLDEGPFEPMDFPRLLFVALAVLLAAALFQGRSEERLPGMPAEGPASRRGLLYFATLPLSVTAYVLLAETLGFVLTAGGILLLLLVALGTRLATSLLVTLVLVPLIYELFANLLRVPLPRGLLGW